MQRQHISTAYEYQLLATRLIIDVKYQPDTVLVDV